MSKSIFIKKLKSLFFLRELKSLKTKILVPINQFVNLIYSPLSPKYFLDEFYETLSYSYKLDSKEDFISEIYSQKLSLYLRCFIRAKAGLKVRTHEEDTIHEQLIEINYLMKNHQELLPMFKAITSKRVLYAGQAYYNAWYLSRNLRKYGWKADVFNWDSSPSSQIYYHGEDFRFDGNADNELSYNLKFYIASLYEYDIFHFSNAHGICFGYDVQGFLKKKFGEHSEIFLLKQLGKKVVYSNNACNDGVSQTAFSKWGSEESACASCRWQSEPNVCSDERNLTWGIFRNKVADFQCMIFGNRVDYNDDPRVHEVPEFYCLDTEVWNPQIDIPESFRLIAKSDQTTWLYHAVGNKAERSINEVNIKSSHIYLPLVQKLKDEGLSVDLIEATGIPNRNVRFLQAQADIFLDMLTVGWFGANAREGMMLGKPVICYILPDFLENVRKELPDYAAELPIVSATPNTVEEILRDLIANSDKRREIGQRSRDFAVKWHSAEAGGRRFDQIYTKLLQGDPLLRIMN